MPFPRFQESPGTASKGDGALVPNQHELPIVCQALTNPYSPEAFGIGGVCNLEIYPGPNIIGVWDEDQGEGGAGGVFGRRVMVRARQALFLAFMHFIRRRSIDPDFPPMGGSYGVVHPPDPTDLPIPPIPNPEPDDDENQNRFVDPGP